ncbi:hypothetical protein QO010_001708 [Caulobacter ginsengisoli]|uniref:Alpha/beta hydrolase n=1 Tax=Caulobacter ginsengisoli TaxID=400775 RepID=A0ABU0ISL4_9CAUL|nr:alpha/beta hydrolase [Caulobacter ginsengisoli]MDQ0463937.1 hypothetical protein [Caulobacter ginsengisoli]
MVLFLDYRSAGVGGSVTSSPRVYEAGVPATGSPIAYNPVATLPNVTGVHLVFATHGFNVSRPKGVRSLTRLGQALAAEIAGLGGRMATTPAELSPNAETRPTWYFMGVLWPGDWALPQIPLNYIGAGPDADASGRRLAEYADSHFPGAASVSLISHSMGARLVLTAANRTGKTVRQICVAAPAVDDRILADRQRFEAARRRAARTTVMSSMGDNVLKLAYPAGTLAALVGRQDDMPFGTALGYSGSRPNPLTLVDNTAIPKAQKYDHGDYLPSEDMTVSNFRVDRSIHLMAQAMVGGSSAWPY